MVLILIGVVVVVLIGAVFVMRAQSTTRAPKKRSAAPTSKEHSAMLEAVAIREKLEAAQNEQVNDAVQGEEGSFLDDDSVENEEDEDDAQEDDEDEYEEVEIEVPEEILHFSLFTEEDLTESQIKEIHLLIKNIPRPSGIFTPLSVGQFGPKELAELVSQDPEIAAKILRVVNSAAYHLHKKINSVNRAVVFLGTTLVRDIAMRLAMQNSFKAKSAEQDQAYQRFWKMSIISSAAHQNRASHFRWQLRSHWSAAG
jgi:hypothetical protein